MIWPSKITIRCDLCHTEQEFDNPGQYAMSVVCWKIMAQGWSLPPTGKHLCPSCKVKVAQKAGVPTEWFEANSKVKATIDEVEKLPNGPVPHG
jgi:hypothetical protein